ncbi:DUF808 domain-containing protein [Enterobacillus tribolii]|uniref:Inner membrane protein YedI n=1 Tax=Enterobacillus tribolii TaxID=1487935 RepID=A0A370QHH7_9GAMM|nr:DUF808 domain-containing protein [Enterobacillus tribolii]MBW7982518.1 DUF808 domain-containing protein [Enterobacillus tribolii]RDK87797.1 hypothetical protein C8D90_10865 [Enterobacillus tribolii]
MAGSSLLTLIDDIASVLDDVAMMSKMAARKTAGVLGDDLALNAQQVSGVRAEREIPVVWAVAKGSLLNKVILVPLALLISAFIPWAITPLLMLGGAFLCYEGFEKIAHRFLHGKDEKQDAAESESIPQDLALYEKQKVKGAVRTDFILSAEIVAITLGTVAEATFLQQVIVLSGIALIMTVGVYGIVAGIVKLDDLGLWMSKKSSALVQRTGGLIVNAAPYLMKLLSVVGTMAMFMVGGGIIVHGLPWVHHLVENLAAAGSTLPVIGSTIGFAGATLLNMLFGVVAGAVVLALVGTVTRLLPRRKA